jgi:hypothetical protein
LNEAVSLLLGRLPEAPEVWDKIPADSTVTLSVALELTSRNQGFTLDPDILGFLGKRKIGLDVDIYRD